MENLKQVDLALKSLYTLLEEYESDPTSQQYKDTLEAIVKITELHNSLIEIQIKTEETRRKLEMQERKTDAEIEEIENRPIYELKKMGIQFGELTAVGISVAFWESKGHIIKTTALRLLNEARRVLPFI